ncbi:MAG: lysophospholipid acyltransferase family protein [Spartobacteria bacterium]
MNHPLRDWLEYAGLSAAAWLIAQLDFRSLRPLADFIGSIVYFLDPRGRRTALQNLESAFAKKFSPAQKRRIARGSYRTFARTMLELLWAPNLTEEFVRNHIVFEGWEHDTCRANPEKSAIYCCMHFSNFEWLSLVGAYSFMKGPVIAQNFKNPFLGPIFNRLRSSTGNTVIPQERAMIRMFKHLQLGGQFGLLIDLNLDPEEGSVPISCFNGLTACVTPAHVALAQRTGAAIVPMECRPLEDGRYRVIRHSPIECSPQLDPVLLVQECWDALEKGIHIYPECWLWPYKYWRHKPRENNERYPTYANYSTRFDELLKNHASARA